MGTSASLNFNDDRIVKAMETLAKSSNRTSNISLVVSIIALVFSAISTYYAYKSYEISSKGQSKSQQQKKSCNQFDKNYGTN